MADNNPPQDPSAQFQEYVTQWERSVDQFFNQMMGTEQFSQSMNQMQTLQLEMQKAFRENMTKQLASMNLPSRDDVLQIGEDIREVDARLARVEASLAQLVKGSGLAAAKSQNKQGPKRTRKPKTAEE